jgi:hypothetical protein
MYYLDYENRHDNKLKGITKAVKDNLLLGEHYLDSLLGQVYYVKNQTRIQVKDHQIITLQEDKKALSADDTKRFITNDPTITRPLGHYLNNSSIKV